MKRKLSCLLIALVMLVALLPTVSLVASADEGPAVGTYEYYAQKGMWYDDGHMIAAVDMTHITEENVLLNSGGLNSGNVGEDVRFIYSSTTTAPGGYAALENTNKHAYIRIVDGQAEYKGKFFLLSISRDGTTPKAAAAVGTNTYAKAIYPDEFGNITYNINITQSPQNSSGGNELDNGAINLGHAFGADELSTSFRINGISNFIWAGTTYDSSNIGNYGSLREAWWSILGDDYNNPYGDTLPSYAVETVTKISTTTTGANQLVALSSSHWISGGNLTRQLCARFENGKLSYFYTNFQQTNLSPTYEMLDDTSDNYYSAISTQVLTSIEYKDANTAASPTVDLDYTFMLPGKIYTKSVEGSTKFDARSLQPKSTDASQVLFVRIYDQNLTAEQMKQNHLADLMYYYNIDLKTLDAADFTEYYDEAMALSVGLHNTGDEATDYIETVAALNAMVGCGGECQAEPDDKDCTTPTLCAACNKELIPAPSTAHTAGADDGDCTTPVMCSNAGCEKVATPAAAQHVAGADDGDCTTAVKCANCDENAIAAKASHEAEADDGDCTTEVQCKNCDEIVVPAEAAHTPEADDGDCTTAQGCTECDKIAVAAKDAHTGGTATCTAKAKCSVCNKEYGELKAHTPAEDDGDCTTAIKCTKCDAETTAAKAAHTYGDDDLCTVCGMENPDKGLGTGAVTGIVVGSVAVAGGAGAAIWWFIFKKKKI